MGPFCSAEPHLAIQHVLLCLFSHLLLWGVLHITRAFRVRLTSVVDLSQHLRVACSAYCYAFSHGFRPRRDVVAGQPLQGTRGPAGRLSARGATRSPFSHISWQLKSMTRGYLPLVCPVLAYRCPCLALWFMFNAEATMATPGTTCQQRN